MPSITISGALTPDITGTYPVSGTNDGQNYYTNGTWYLWYRAFDAIWLITTSAPGAELNSDGYWVLNSSMEAAGDYLPTLPAEGTATAAYYIETPGTLTAAGTPTPDVTGEYVEVGDWDTQPYYRNDALDYYIWYYGSDARWYLSESIGSPYSSSWTKYAGVTVDGTYEPVDSAIGDIVVSAGAAPTVTKYLALQAGGNYYTLSYEE